MLPYFEVHCVGLEYHIAVFDTFLLFTTTNPSPTYQSNVFPKRTVSPVQKQNDVHSEELLWNEKVNTKRKKINFLFIISFLTGRISAICTVGTGLLMALALSRLCIPNENTTVILQKMKSIRVSDFLVPSSFDTAYSFHQYHSFAARIASCSQAIDIDPRGYPNARIAGAIPHDRIHAR